MNDAFSKSTEISSKNDIEVSIASNEEGLFIKSLLEQSIEKESLEIIDWNDVYPYWLIAKKDQEIMGCIQVSLGKPIGHIEMLAVNKNLHPIKRSQIAWKLIVFAMNVLKLHGSQTANSVVSFENKGFKRLLKKRGWQVSDSGNLMTMRIM